MDIQHVNNYFVVFKGRGDAVQYFSFFVDGTKSAWSKFLWRAAQYDNKGDAQGAIKMIRKRECQRRTESAARKQESE